MKSASTIDLMKTPNGYSLIENENLLNKSFTSNLSQQNTGHVSGGKYNK